jgi:hypothetical protein
MVAHVRINSQTSRHSSECCLLGLFVIGGLGSGLPSQDVFASTFSSQAVAERCDKISVDQESDGLLNDIVRGFLLEGLVQSSYGNAETASFGVLFMEIAQNFLSQTLNLNQTASRS